MRHKATLIPNSPIKNNGIIDNHIDKYLSSDTYQALVSSLEGIPKYVRETVLYDKINRFSEKDISYSDFQWLQSQICSSTYLSSVNFLKNVKNKTKLDNYILSIIDSKEMGYREKLVVILAHFEALVYQAIKIPREKKSKIKIDTSNLTTKKSPTSLQNFGVVLIWGIVQIIYASTDYFASSIDKKLPFRNNILHRGTLEYSEEEIRLAYETLILCVADIAMIERKINKHNI